MRQIGLRTVRRNRYLPMNTAHQAPKPPILPPLARQGQMGLVALIAAILALLAWSYVITAASQRNERLVNHTTQVLETTGRLLILVVDAETGQRGYLLTGVDSYLQPYEAGLSLTQPLLEELDVLLAGNSLQAARLAPLQGLVGAKLADLARTIHLAQSGQRDAAMAIVRAGEGKAVMDDIRSAIEQIQAEELRLMERHHAGVRQTDVWATVPLSLSIMMLMVLLWGGLHRTMVQNRALLAANADLDARVLQRTSALEQEKLRVDALMQDITHRVGNNLAMVNALLGMQRRKSAHPEVDAALGAAQERIAAIAAGQRRLSLKIDADTVQAKPYLENLLAEITGDAAARGVTIRTAIADIALPGGDALSHIVLVNELITNALKHAFREGETGTVRVTLTEAREMDRDVALLCVEDDGHGLGPVHAAHDNAGIGSTVVATLVRSLNASMVVEAPHPGAFRPGHRTTIVIPR
jgi:two-component sensor histidine kinase